MKYQPAPSKTLLFFRRFLQMVIFFFTITVLLGSITVPIERIFAQHTTPFHTPSDGIGWALATAFSLETHGLMPVTTAGMIIATLLRLLGYTLLGGAIGFVVMHLYLTEAGFQQKTIKDQLDRLEDDQKTLRGKLDFLIKNSGNQPTKPRRWGL